MALAVEGDRYLQAGYYSRRDRLLVPIPREVPYPEGTFLDSLNPTGTLPPAVEPGTLLDISFMEADMLELIALSTQPERRINSHAKISTWQDQGTVVYSDPGHPRHTERALTPGFLEVGRNTYRHPYDNLNYPALPIIGVKTEVPGLFPHLRKLANEGMTTVFTKHRHKVTPFPFPPDMAIVQVEQMEGSELPIVNGFGIITEDVQVIGRATDKTPGVLPYSEVKRKTIGLKEDYKKAGGRERVVWERRLDLMTEGSRKYRKERRRLDQFVQEARDELTAEFAEQLAIQFYRSTDMKVGVAMPIRRIIRMHREDEQERYAA